MYVLPLPSDFSFNKRFAQGVIAYEAAVTISGHYQKQPHDFDQLPWQVQH